MSSFSHGTTSRITDAPLLSALKAMIIRYTEDSHYGKQITIDVPKNAFSYTMCYGSNNGAMDMIVSNPRMDGHHR